MKKLVYSMLVCFTVLAYVHCSGETITILHLNDTHSYLSAGGPKDANNKGTLGGIARAATYIATAKALDPNTLFLHAGDFSIGDLFFNKYFGVSELQILGALGLDAMTLGNHEFDLGPTVLQTVLIQGFADHSFPLLSANFSLDDAALTTLKNYVTPYTIKTIGTAKIGIFGLTTPLTMQISNPSPAVISQDIMTIVPAVMTELYAQDCNMIIMLSHMGMTYDTMIARNVPGIDIIIGGHDHYNLSQELLIPNAGGTTHYVQVGSFYEHIGRFDIDWNNGIQAITWQNITLDQNIAEEPTTAAQVATMETDIEQTWSLPFFSQMVATATDFFGEAATDLLKQGNKATAVGNLVSDAYLNYGHTDIAVQPSGSTAYPIYAGGLDLDDIYRINGYGFNTANGLGFRMATFKITGKNLYYGLVFGLMQLTSGDDFLIQCAGMNYDVTFGEQGQVLALDVKVGGVPLDTLKTYTVTSNEFVPMVFQSFGYAIEELAVSDANTEFSVLSAYITGLGTISPNNEARVRFLNDVFSPVAELVPPRAAAADVFPNPCTDAARISLNIDEAGYYTLNVYDQFGRTVSCVLNEYIDTGRLTRAINTKSLSGGVYYYKLSGAGTLRTGRIIVNK